MKTTAFIRHAMAVALLALITASCAPRYASYGTAHDRTGTNGATNGNGKAPSTSAHSFRY